MLKGIEVTEESLSLDVIDDVCKGPGHFLGHAQTLALMNSEYLYPGLLDRDSRDDWERKGARDIREAARERARKVLAGHRAGERRVGKERVSTCRYRWAPDH